MISIKVFLLYRIYRQLISFSECTFNMFDSYLCVKWICECLICTSKNYVCSAFSMHCLLKHREQIITYTRILLFTINFQSYVEDSYEIFNLQVSSYILILIFECTAVKLLNTIFTVMKTYCEHIFSV